MRICSAPGCYARVTSGRCPTHRRPAWTQARPTPRVRGRKLQQLRQNLFSRQPFCALCWEKTPRMLTLAVIRDHIVPLAEHGRDDEDNVQPLCRACSDAKSDAESRRGRRRSHGTGI